MFFRYIFITTILIFNIYANDKINNNIGFINISSDINETKIYLDNKYIGDTPIERYQVKANKNIKLKAVANKKFYLKEFIRNINVKPLEIQSYKTKFKRSNAKLLLVGKDGYLYINDRFERTLNSNNRIITIPSSKKIKIEIKNGDDKYIAIKDMYAGEFYKLEYNLDKNSIKNKKLQDKNKSKTPSDVVVIDKLMWQDTKDITTNKLLYKKAKKYCENLDLEGYKDWGLPTIEQLKALYKDKNKFYNKFNKNFYWSSTRTKGEYVYWDYLLTKSFDNGLITTINGSSNEANVVCVRVFKIE